MHRFFGACATLALSLAAMALARKQRCLTCKT